ncbi:MAG: sigma 54-interacting transcriptional regulator [Firmicutes bacterium]|nr:sigma 54-interacting transcriptional regulator [Bacillota bacterium]
MMMLDLDIDIVNRNLFRHIQSVLESNTAFHDNYINSYLKTEMLGHIAKKAKIAMVLVDNQYRVVYANPKVASVFQVSDVSKIHIEDYIGLSILTESETPSETLEISGQRYYYNKYSFMLMDETVGYYITLQDEADIADANRQNIQKGYVAKYQFKDIVHQSPAMKTIIDKARQIAPTDYTILIRGESGTGKELIAQSIHNASFRSSGPFVAINCASLPENLLESELFGYDAGAFTGAKGKGKTGLFEQANHGTIFLDEIGDLPLSLQARLLRALQERQVLRLGSDHLIDVDIRIITATNKDLETAVSAGAFRADLFFRLNVLPLTLPPLRNRKEDIPGLMEHFLGSVYRNITREESEILTNYSWPGNIRELENIATYYNALSSLPDYLYDQSSSFQSSAVTSAEDLDRNLLEVIAAGTSVSHGVGRSSILHTLKGRGIDVSDGKLRDMLASLENRNLVEIGKGRGGTRITTIGKSYLGH